MSNQEKVQYINISIVIFMIMLLLSTSVIVFDNNNSFFLGNIAPELIGICIEVLIIIWIFEVWQNRKQHQKDIVNEKRLREYLKKFLDSGLKGLPEEYKISNFYGKNSIKNREEVDKIIDYLSLNKIDTKLLNSMKQHLLIDKTALENLLEVASLLSDVHFKSWIRIVYFVNTLSTIKCDYKLKLSIIDILKYIKRFDKASYSNNIYVDAKKSYYEYNPKKIFKLITKFTKSFSLIIMIVIIILFVYKLTSSFVPINEEINSSSNYVNLNLENLNDVSKPKIKNIYSNEELDYLLILVLTLFLFSLWMYSQYYKKNTLNVKNIFTTLVISSTLSITGTMTFNIFEMKIEKFSLFDDFTLLKDIYNKNSFEFYRTIKPIEIYFDKGSILSKKNNIENLENTFNKKNKYFIKVTGYSSTEAVLNQNSINNNYHISLARANNIKKIILDIVDKNYINRQNIVIDVFAHSNQDIDTNTINKHAENRKVIIEIDEFKQQDIK